MAQTIRKIIWVQGVSLGLGLLLVMLSAFKPADLALSGSPSVTFLAGAFGIMFISQAVSIYQWTRLGMPRSGPAQDT